MGSGYGLFSNLAHFISNHSKTTPGITCASGFDGGVQSQQVRLIGNIGNHTHNLPDDFCLPDFTNRQRAQEF